MELTINGFRLGNLSSVNVILGKNGCGKSHLLKEFERQLRSDSSIGALRYISPERGGLLQYESGIEQNLMNSPQWMDEVRRKNQSNNFRQQSTILFRRLELLTLREIEEQHNKPGYVPTSFGSVIDSLNVLLDRVKIERDKIKPFRIIDRVAGSETDPERISSGESELISLGIELLSFIKESERGKANLLFIDEPDVHLHPDLQDRLAEFICRILKKSSVTLVLATHSTAILAGLANRIDTKVAFMKRGYTALDFKTVTEVEKKILPIFGAHPLSNIFNQSPVLLIEGEDDERIWQQVVRSSVGKIRIFPCVVTSVNIFSEFETEVRNILDSVYDTAKGYSLRDRDVNPEAIDDVGQIVRMRLSCRAAENLFLADDCLAFMETNWEKFKVQVASWIELNQNHRYHVDVKNFMEAGFKRKEHDLKDIRNILAGLVTNKPWEVVVGQSIASLTKGSKPGEGSLTDFLGKKVCKELLGIHE